MGIRLISRLKCKYYKDKNLQICCKIWFKRILNKIENELSITSAHILCVISNRLSHTENNQASIWNYIHPLDSNPKNTKTAGKSRSRSCCPLRHCKINNLLFGYACVCDVCVCLFVRHLQLAAPHFYICAAKYNAMLLDAFDRSHV